MQTRTRRQAGALAVVLAMAGAVLVPTAAHAASAVVGGETREVLEDPIRLETGHIDAFTPVLNEDDLLRLALKEDVTGSGVLRTPESVELFVKEDALVTFPEGAPRPPDMPAEVYYLPLTQDHNLIWPGWETQLITSVYPGADTDIVVSSVDGPGSVFVWSSGNWGALQSLMKDGASYELPNTISQPYPAHTHAAWGFTEPGVYTMTVRAEVTANNGNTGSTQDATYTFVVGDQPAPEQTVEISGLSHHYHQNTPVVLTAVAEPEVQGATYEWSVQRTDQSAPVVVDGQTGAEFRITAEQALNGAQVSVRVLDADGEELAASEPVVIDVDDHGAAPLQTVTVEGAAHHYHSGDTATLTASVSPASVLSRYEWQVQQEGETDWNAVTGENDAEYAFEVTEELNGALVRAVLTFDDGTEYVASEPVAIEIDDHHGEEPVETTLTIAGLSHHYHTGDVAELTAEQNPATGEDHYHWFIKRAGADEFEVIRDGDGVEGALTANLKYTVLEGDAGAEVIARLYDHDHTMIAESAPAVVEIDDHHGEEPPAGKPEAAPEQPADGALDDVAAGGIELGASTVQQGGTVTILVGEGAERAGEWVAAWLFSDPVLLGGDWAAVAANGTLTVTIPAATEAGTHRIAVYDAAGSLIGWQSLEVTAAGGSGGSGESGGEAGGGSTNPIANTGAQSSQALLVAGAMVLLAFGAGAALTARRRTQAAQD